MAVKKTAKSQKKTKTAAKGKSAARRPPAKAAAKAPSGKNGKNRQTAQTVKTAATAPAPPKVNNSQPPEVRAQYQAFERAIPLFHKRQFREAKEWFERARTGPVKELAANAELHVKMCERRLAAPPPAPRSLEEHYNYAIALINARHLAEARQHLDAALKMDARADHVHYALGVCLGLSGDLPGAYDSLRRAIELQPRNRMLARQDSDLEDISRRPPLHRLLYPEY